MLKRYSAALLISASACLAGCGTAGDRSGKDLPSYATLTNNGMGWAVKCPLQTVTNPLNRNFQIFRNEDGSFKTHEQFCAENDASRRTNR